MLTEGGNVFKDEQGTPLTQRINQQDVEATIQWLERVTGVEFPPERWLGSTGKKPTSGDLDLAIDTSEISKEDLAQRLTAFVTKNGQDPRTWVKKAGEVHFRTPIAGRSGTGFVQTDFMFFPNVDWGTFYYAGGEDSAYKGMIRNVLMSSLAKNQGLKIGANGIISRTTNELIPDGLDPDHAAELLLGPGRSRADLRNVETIYNNLARDPQRDAKLADFREFLSREGLQEPTTVTESDVSFLARLRDRIVNQGMVPIMEDRNPRIPYIEDLVFQKGLTGVSDALAIIDDTAQNTRQYATQKWDGSPAVIFGRDEQGRFRLTDKGTMGPEGPARSIDDVASVMAQRDQRAAEQGKAADRVTSLLPMYRELWPYLERATPRDFRGYLKGDMLYSSADPVRREDGMLKFQPNKHDGIAYSIPQDSALGRAIAQSRTGLAVHTQMADPGAPEMPVGDPARILRPVPGLMVTGAEVPDLRNIEPDPGILGQIRSLAQGQTAQALKDLLDPAALRQNRITDLPALMERFINSLKGTDYTQAQPGEFGRWLRGQVTPQKLENTINYLRESPSRLLGMQTAFDIWNLLHGLKQDVQRQLDQQVPGQEGWVLATPAGRAKIVSRMAGGFGGRKARPTT